MEKQDRTCFLVSPIGDPGSDVRQAADDLYDLIIVPSLKMFGLTVVRADMIPSPSIITNDIVQLVQQSELCVIDLTGSNPNVFYECGRRHETGKPFIQLIKKGESLPFDVQGIRTIEYDLTTARSVHDTIGTVQQFVAELEKGFGPGTRGVSLISISEILQRIERKIEHGLADNAILLTSAEPSFSSELTPVEKMKLHFNPEEGIIKAVDTGDVKLARECLHIMVDEKWGPEKIFPYAYIFASLGDQKVAKPLLYEILDRESFDLFHDLPFHDKQDAHNEDFVPERVTDFLPKDVIGMVYVIYEVFSKFGDYSKRIELLVPRIKQILEERTDIADNDKKILLDYIAVSYSTVEDYESAMKYASRGLEIDPTDLKLLFDEIYYCNKLNRRDARLTLAKRLAQQIDEFDNPKYFAELIPILRESENEEIVEKLTIEFDRKYPDDAAAFAASENQQGEAEHLH